MFCYLVRHGKDDDTVRGGWSNHGLTSLGVEQINRLAEEMVATEKNCFFEQGKTLFYT